jgi:hypothetical protein
MGFPLEVVGAGKQKITERSHIKYADSVARAWERIFQKMVGSEACSERLYIYIYIQKKTCRMPN